MKTLAWSLTILLATGVVAGQDVNTANTLRLNEGAPRPAAAIEDIAWLAGFWEGEAFGGRFEDVWSLPSAGTMMGMFKVFEEGAPSFYELQLIVEEKGSLTWRVKHFSADFSAWEEKAEAVDFPLVRIEPEAAYFSGLTVRRAGPDELRVFLAMTGPEGPSEAAMVYRRGASHSDPGTR